MKHLNYEERITTYKAFNNDLTCMDFQYEVGNTYHEEEPIRICYRGFHACIVPNDVLRYYYDGDIRVCEVEQWGDIDETFIKMESKICSSDIYIKRELTKEEFFNECVKQRFFYKDTLIKINLPISIKNLDILSTWDVSNIRILDNTFSNFDDLENVDALETWDVSNVRFIEYLFQYCISLKNIKGLKNWNVSKLSSLKGIFYNCLSLRDITPLKEWDVSNVIDAETAFYHCVSIENLDALSKWDTSKFKKMGCMFENCSQLNNVDGIAKWNVANVEDMDAAFFLCTAIKQMDFSAWDTRNVKGFNAMFKYCTGLETLNLSNWVIINPSAKLDSMFHNCYSLTTVIVNNCDAITKMRLLKELNSIIIYQSNGSCGISYKWIEKDNKLIRTEELWDLN